MLLYGQDAFIADWCAKQLKLPPFEEGLYVAVGIMLDDKLVGGVVWNNYHTDAKGNPLLIEATLVTIDKRWASRHNLRELFAYPFIQLNVKRVQATCHRKARRVRTTLTRLGFQFEGVIRQAHPNGGDAAHYSILKHECFWLRGYKSGEISTAGTSRTRPNRNGSGTNCQQ